MVSLSDAVFAKYADLDQFGKVLAEYVWIGGSGSDLRSKTRTLDEEVKDVSQLPIWNFDGSSTGQAPGSDSEVFLKPAAIFRDPFRGGKNILVLCECTYPDGEPIPTNTRHEAAIILEKAKHEEPWFGIEQEYTFFESDGVTPLGWPKNGFPGPQGPYYCGAGTGSAIGRKVADAHYKACLYAGIQVSGINAEVMAAQWEYQVGPCLGIASGDQMWISRYIMTRICEDFGMKVSFYPKPIRGDWNGAGCHTNFSTQSMRSDGGYDVILAAMKKLEKSHEKHIAVYGEDNQFRLTGRHETAPIDKFSFGVANRGASVRIPRQTFLDKKGYFEDRRPASNMDPYLVTSLLVQTTVLDGTVTIS